MALTGLQIQKLLPKTNCKECGSNTCLAFAMKLAAKKADLSQCPYASEEAKQILGAASEPPVKGVAFGTDKSLTLGEETVLYRHEKTFVNQTLLAININDTDPPDQIENTLDQILEEPDSLRRSLISSLRDETFMDFIACEIARSLLLYFFDSFVRNHNLFQIDPVFLHAVPYCYAVDPEDTGSFGLISAVNSDEFGLRQRLVRQSVGIANFATSDDRGTLSIQFSPPRYSYQFMCQVTS